MERTDRAAQTFERLHAVVIDNNVLRESTTIERLAAAHLAGGPAIALPEIAFFEMTKNPEHWERTIRDSLMAIAQHPNAVVLTTALKPLAVVEHRTGRPTTSVVSPRTTVFRQVLRDYGSGGTFDDFLTSVKAGRSDLEHDAHANDSLATMRRLEDIALPVTERERRAAISRDLSAPSSKTSARP